MPMQMWVVLIEVGILGFLFWYIEKNRYAVPLFIIFGCLVFFGTIMGLKGMISGMLPFLLGLVFFSLGLEGPQSDDKEKKGVIWLVTYRGKRTSVIVRRTSLFLRTPFDIVGKIEVVTENKDIDFPLTKPILCLGDNAYVYGKVSATVKVDDKDDPKDTPNRQLAGQKVQDFLDMGGYEQVKPQLDDIVTAWLQELARDPETTTVIMETQNVKIGQALLEKIENGEVGRRAGGSNTANTKQLGVRFSKFEVELSPDPLVMKARNDRLVEMNQRPADLDDSETLSQQVEARLVKRTEHGAEDWDKVEEQIFREKALKAKALKIVENRGGVNVTKTDETDKSDTQET